MAFIRRKDTETPESEKLPREPTEHDLLVLRAERWLKSVGCAFAIRDPFRCLAEEQPDAIGWREGISVLVEVKTSRSDFYADRKKPFRRDPESGMGNWRFYMCPPELIQADELPEGWGLIWATPKRVIQSFSVPPNTGWFKAPFSGNRQAESLILTSVIRRLDRAGHLNLIYGSKESR